MGTFFSARHLCLQSKWPTITEIKDVLQKRMFRQHYFFPIDGRMVLRVQGQRPQKLPIASLLQGEIVNPSMMQRTNQLQQIVFESDPHSYEKKVPNDQIWSSRYPCMELSTRFQPTALGQYSENRYCKVITEPNGYQSD